MRNLRHPAGSRTVDATKSQPEPRSLSMVFQTNGTRWMDNDVYGHVNNVVYDSWFDTAVNASLIEQGVLGIHNGPTIALVIETQCNYYSPLAFAQNAHAGIRVARLGSSSVLREVGLFAMDQPSTAAKGHFIHVDVNRHTHRPTPLPANFNHVWEKLL